MILWEAEVGPCSLVDDDDDWCPSYFLHDEDEKFDVGKAK